MPFTFAHPAIVLPLASAKRKWFSLSGLIIGSMSPDFEYFFRMKVQSEISHTIAGLFLFDLPASILIALIFHVFVKKALINNLPEFLRSRFCVYANKNWVLYLKSSFPVVVISILIGAASHIFWDAFTHAGGYFALHISLLQKMLINTVPAYKILQHTSSAIGVVVIAFAIYRLPQSINCQYFKSNKKSYWFIALLTFSVIICFYLSLVKKPVSIGNAVVAGIDSICIGILLASIISGKNSSAKPNF